MKENNKLKLIALLIAILLFASVNDKIKNFSVLGNKEIAATTWVQDIPLDVDYDRDKFYISGIPNTISVKISGSSVQLQKANLLKSVKAKLNLRDMEIGDNQSVKVEIEGLDSGMSGVGDPEYLTVSVREKKTKEFKVVPFVKKERILTGYSIKSSSVSDETVKISGSKDSLENIYEVRAESSNKTKINKDIKEEVTLVAYDKDYSKIEDIEIEPKTTIMTVQVNDIEKEVPVIVNTVGVLPAGRSLVSLTSDPEKILIRANSDEELKKVSAIYVDVELTNIDADETIKTNLKIYTNGDHEIALDTKVAQVTIKTKKS